jgi:hypothetical protein
MADLTVSTISPGAGDHVKQVLENHDAGIILVANNFIDTVDPTTPPNGREWVRSDGANGGVKYAQIGGAKTEILYQYILNQNLDAGGNQITNLVSEKLATGSLPTPGASTEGETPWDSTVERSTETSSTDNYYRARCNTDASTYKAIPCVLQVAGQGTPATEDAATIAGGWTLDAATERLNVVALERIPVGWTGANDLLLVADVQLENAETASDTIDLDGVWWSLAVGENVSTKGSTAFAAASQSIGANASQYDRHIVTLTIDYDDATNTVATGSQFIATLQHDPAAGGAPVAGIIVVAVYLLVPVFNYRSA